VALASLLAVTTVLLACDDDDLAATVDAAVVDATTRLARVTEGRQVLAAVDEVGADVVVLDLQIGNMGGMATCRDLRLESGAGRLAPQRIIVLCDRDADVFLARQSGADAWLVKPLDAIRLRSTIEQVLATDPTA